MKHARKCDCQLQFVFSLRSLLLYYVLSVVYSNSINFIFVPAVMETALLDIFNLVYCEMANISICNSLSSIKIKKNE